MEHIYYHNCVNAYQNGMHFIVCWLFFFLSFVLRENINHRWIQIFDSVCTLCMTIVILKMDSRFITCHLGSRFLPPLFLNMVTIHLISWRSVFVVGCHQLNDECHRHLLHRFYATFGSFLDAITIL